MTDNANPLWVCSGGSLVIVEWMLGQEAPSP